jgi:hypothetical protein
MRALLALARSCVIEKKKLQRENMLGETRMGLLLLKST